MMPELATGAAADFHDDDKRAIADATREH